MDELRTATGKWVSFDHSYLVCGSCHAKQLMDWAGGAHGKRLQYWHGARIIETCTGCHNPHQPRFPKHWSKTQPAATTKPATTQPQTTQPATQAASPNPPINKGKN
jgi:hypothetical protein